MGMFASEWDEIGDREGAIQIGISVRTATIAEPCESLDS